MNTPKNKQYKKLFYQLKSKHKETSPTFAEAAFNAHAEMVHLFHKKHGHYPTTNEFKHDNMLPSARFIQRNYGGIPKFRKDIGLDVTDYTKGTIRTEKIKKVLARAKEYEQELYTLLFKKFHNPEKNIIIEREPVISRHDPDTDTYGYRRADIAIHDYSNNSRNTKFIDFFYASTPESFSACVRNKNNKIKGLIDTDSMIYVSVNPNFSEEDVKNFPKPKNSPQVLSYSQFKNQYL